MLLIFTLACALLPFETKLNKVNSFTHPKSDRYAKENCQYKKAVISKRIYTSKSRNGHYQKYSQQKLKFLSVIPDAMQDVKVWLSAC